MCRELWKRAVNLLGWADLNIHSRRSNLIFYRVNESKDKDCFSLVRDVLTRNLNLPQDEASNMKLCGAHCLGKPNRNRAWPLIARFTCRADRDCIWKARYRLKNSRISMGEDLPRQIQEIRKNVLIPAMKKIKQETPSHKATVVGDKLVVNGKFIFIMTCRRNGSLSTLQWIPRWIMAMVQPNNKNHCKVKKNPLLLWSNPKNCLVKVSRWRFFCKSNPFTDL